MTQIPDTFHVEDSEENQFRVVLRMEEPSLARDGVVVAVSIYIHITRDAYFRAHGFRLAVLTLASSVRFPLLHHQNPSTRDNFGKVLETS